MLFVVLLSSYFNINCIYLFVQIASIYKQKLILAQTLPVSCVEVKTKEKSLALPVMDFHLGYFDSRSFFRVKERWR